MLFSNRKIIAIYRGKLIATEVYDPVTKKFGRTYEFGWQPETLDLTLAEVIKKFQTNEYRILVSDELSYVVRLTIPSTVPKAQIRAYILDKLQEKIPEQVDDNEWDYKEIRNLAGEGLDIIAFALVKTFAAVLFRAINKLGINIVAIEPETIAKTRDANAYIGLSLKTDLRGPDPEVLNITPNQVTDEVESKKVVEAAGENTVKVADNNYIRLNRRIVFLIIAVMLVGLFAGGFFYLRSRSTNVTQKENPNPTSTVQNSASETPSSTPSPTPSPTPNSPELSVLRVQLQNGTGIAGEAGNVQKILESEGFKIISSTNADTFDHDESEVSLKPQYDMVYDTLDRALNSEYTLIKSDTLPDDSQNDIVIIIGKKK